MAWRPITVPLSGGVREDLALLHIEGPELLRVAKNVVYTKRGSVRGRPGYQARAGVNSPVQDGRSLTTWTTTHQPAGIVGIQAHGAHGTESPLALYHGIQYIGRAQGTSSTAVWSKVGDSVFVRKTVSPVMKTLLSPAGTKLHPAGCGTNLMAVFQEAPAVAGLTTVGFPFLNTKSQKDYVGTGTTLNWDTASEANHAVAGNNVYYCTGAAGDVRGHIKTSTLDTSAATTDVSIGTGGRGDTNAIQNIAAVRNINATFDYVAYRSSTAGRITLKSVVPTTGAVTSTLDVNGLGTVLGVAVAYQNVAGTERLMLAWIDTAGPTLRTKVFTVASGVFTDAALDVNFATAPYGTDPEHAIAAGTTTVSGTVSVMYRTSTGNLFIGGRSLTAATTTSSFELRGVTGGLFMWTPLFGGVSVGGLTLIGVQRDHFGSAAANNGQWFVLDVTRLYSASEVNHRLVVAHGPSGGIVITAPTSAGMPTSTSIAFCVPVGLEFDSDGISRAGYRRIHLALAPSAATSGHGLTLFTGGTAHLFDGNRLGYHPFPETYPMILTPPSQSIAGGTLLGGSYSYQATWELVNGAGQVVRSGASLVKTFTGVAANNKNELAVTVPQLAGYQQDQVHLRVMLWGTERNPAAGAPLYFITSNSITPPAGSAYTTLTHSTEVDTTNAQLYTVGDVLDDEPPPAGDRGVAHAAERLWVADQDRVYASKLLVPSRAPAWNTEGTHTIEVPSQLGEVQGLAAYDDRLVVVCSDGVALVRGPGFDDQGLGGGWVLDAIPGIGAGESQPRRVITTPAGVVFRGKDRNTWVVDASGVPSALAPAVADNAALGDLTFLPPAHVAARGTWDATRETAKIVAMYTSDVFKVYDLDNSAWSSWEQVDTFITHIGAVNGVLWGQLTGYEINLVSYDATTGQDAVQDGALTDITMTIRTGSIVLGSPSGWGRLRKVTLHGNNPTGTQTVFMIAHADNAGHLIINDSEPWGATVNDGLWPRNTGPEFWPTVQRVSSVQIEISITKALVELISLDLWVFDTGAVAPSNIRS